MWDGCALKDCVLRESFWTGCKLKKLTAEGVDLSGVSFFHTPLSGLDFSTCGIEGLTVSESLSELRGLTIGAHQAIDLIKLLGVKVTL